MRSALVLLPLLFLAAAAFWSEHGRAHPERRHTVMFAVNPKAGDDTCNGMLMDVSDPDSPNYGKHKTLEQVNAVFLDGEAVARVNNWLRGLGYETEVVQDFISVTSTVSDLEELLQAEFKITTHADFPKSTFLHTNEHTVPAEIAADVEYVAYIERPKIMPLRRIRTNDGKAAFDYSNSTTPQTLFERYKVPTNITVKKATQAVFASLNQDFSPKDLTTFQNQFKLPNMAVSKVIGINNDQQCLFNPNDCGEANLDVEYMMAMAASNNMIFHSLPNSNDLFTNAMVALSGMTTPPQVYSISYGSTISGRDSLDPSSKRFNQEACKLGIRGVTILISSGDDGANGRNARNGQCGISPSYPATAPYITAVGATIGPQEGKEEVVCASDTGGLITSGGGFSWAFPRPKYQNDSVEAFLTTKKLISSDKFAKKGRGYPDISALGYNFKVVIGGRTVGESGTSASTPTVAGFISLINEQRLAKKKSPLGFLNPALYKAPKNSFYDVTKGRSHCAVGPKCCPDGFYAAAGWDPITGLGAPNVKELANHLLKL